MLPQSGHKLTLVICVALQALPLAACPCQLPDRPESAFVAPESSRDSDGARCLLCRVDATSRTTDRLSFSGPVVHPLAMATVNPTVVACGVATQPIVNPLLAAPPAPTLEDLQVFLE